jgi:PAS domain S-box-containing protein
MDAKANLQKIILDSMNDAVSIVDASTFRILGVNRTFLKDLGFTEDEVIGKHCYEVTHRRKDPCQPPNDMCPLVETVRTGKYSSAEHVHYGKSGDKIYVEVSTSPVKDKSGKVVQVVHVSRDISERKRTEEELRKLNNTLDTLVRYIPEGVLLLDENGQVMHANPVGRKHLEALAVTGKDGVIESISGRPIEDFISNSNEEISHEIKTEEQSKRTFVITGRTISKGDPVGGAVLVINDVTRERELDERVQLQDRLAAVGQLAAGIAHDFNNILTCVLGYSEMLLTEADLPKDVRRQVDTILQSGQRATELIHQILDFTRKSTSELKVVDLMPFIKEFAGFIRRTIPEDIEISFNGDAEKYMVKADLTKMQQVLTNLAVNARDAMPEGGTLNFTLQHRNVLNGEDSLFPGMEKGKWIVLSVRDTGEGINPDNLSHIYEPFFTTKGVGKGTGLGLSQVYGIVKQHNGYIDVKTESGKGTIFDIYLPEVLEPTAPYIGKPVSAMPRGEGETILIVEDDGRVRDLLRSVLESLGYKVLHAENGIGALRLYEAKRDDIKLIITDMVMPGMNGVELSRMLKERDPSLKIIGVSGYPTRMQVKDMRDSGIIEWIPKPFKLQDIAAKVYKVLREK